MINWPWKKNKDEVPFGDHDDKTQVRILHENPTDKETQEYIDEHEKKRKKKEVE